MKKFALLVVLMISSGVLETRACEICGCGVGNFYMGMVPKYGNQFIGVRYRYTNYESKMHDDPEEFSNDYYKTIELWGAWNASKRWQLMAFVPSLVNKRVGFTLQSPMIQEFADGQTKMKPRGLVHLTFTF